MLLCFGPSAFTFRGGYKFAADYEFTAHDRGTLLTYRARNVAPAGHRDRALVRAQFWLAGRLRIGLRGALRTMVPGSAASPTPPTAWRTPGRTCA